ncbi:MAG: hypothetical protein V3V13_08365 [Paracoccaceae bacterium]
MSRAVLHIGLHKTGTSFIQRRIEASRASLPYGYSIIPYKNRALGDLVKNTRKIRSLKQAMAERENITARAARLAWICRKQQHTLISHEDILGPVPTRGNIRGLYPYVQEMLPAVLAGFAREGVRVEVAVYRREYNDWLGSVFRYRFRDNPDRTFRPRRFKENNALPENWDEFTERLQESVAGNPLHIVSFERDRASGNHGTGLYSIFGLTNAVQADFVPMAAQNVTDFATVDPKWFESRVA